MSYNSIFKVVNAKVTQTAAVTNGTQSGGKMTRLRCGGLSAAEEVLFSSKSEWSIAIATDWGILPTLFFVKPKTQGKNNQNSIKIRILKRAAKGMVSKICHNFDSKNSLFDVISHYCPSWDVADRPVDRPSIVKELLTDFLLLEDRYSKRGLLVMIEPGRQIHLKTLSINSSQRSDTILESVSRHVALLGLYENVQVFVDRWKKYLDGSVRESDIEQKRDDFERIGFECYFKREGVDSPASALTLLSQLGKISFNIDIELKHDAKRFFTKSEASNIVKYPRLPLLIVSNEDTSNESNEQQILHPVVCLKNLLEVMSANIMRTLPIVRTAEEEIERLTAIVQGESKDIRKIGKKRKRRVAKAV